ncbi:MAG: bifunctional molybdenum cofactor biosynthesis protein MoaC/MoaB [Saprospirales bacterium]|nr:MAG: bifunctional molybdenum cofactor biosynthesis protein MoaC/MoaB [Saprospirales bacterium]
MVDITHKSSTLRTAIAGAEVKLSNPKALSAVLEGTVPKGNIFEISRAAGLFAVKRTSDMIPDCHPLPIEYTRISHNIKDMAIMIEVEVKTIYKTGVEVEAMHAASVVALTIYDMLKPLDKGITIGDIRLISKKGGKGDFDTSKFNQIKAMVVVCSDSISKGKNEDQSGKAMIQRLGEFGIETSRYEIIPDEVEAIVRLVKEGIEESIGLILFTGGTGISKRDQTPEALIPLLEKRLPGVEETIRHYGQQRTPFAMASRSVVGIAGESIVMALPGSAKGALESIDAVFPHILHLLEVRKGKRH